MKKKKLKEIKQMVERLPFNGTDHQKELKKIFKDSKKREDALQDYFDKVSKSVTPPKVYEA